MGEDERVRVFSTNPASGERRALDVEETSSDDVRALAARALGATLAIADRPLTWRAQLLNAMADEIDGDAERLVELAGEETALPPARLHGELRRTSFQLRFFAGVIADGAFLDATIDHSGDSPMGPLPDLRRVRHAIGPVGVFGSSNFPFAFSVPGGDTASALAAGCGVVIKAHPSHPATSLAAAEALARGGARLGAPEGTVALIFGIDAGLALVDAPEIAAVGFTGSLGAGRALLARANSRPSPIPFYGELGSANPLVVTGQAARERAVEIGVGAAGSITLGAGQFCTKPGLVFVPDGASGDALVDALVGSLRELGGFTMLSTGIAEHFQRGSDAIAAVEGVRTLVDGEPGVGAAAFARLYEVDAARFASPEASVLREECFGPLAVVVRYASNALLLEALNATDPSLTFSAFIGERDLDGRELIAFGARRAGRVMVNSYPTGVAVSWSMHHGGPWPSTTAPQGTSVGAAAIERWLRPVSYQAVPDDILPPALREDNSLGIVRRVDGVLRVS